MKPRFTILTAVYNAGPYLRESIDSVLAQTCEQWELICIDDCSTDGSLDVIKEYAQRDHRIKVMQTPANSGQSVARNLGLQTAQGEFTLMLDADDLLSPDALDSAWQSHLLHPETDTFLFELERFDETGWHERSPHPFQDKTISGKEACHLAIDWRIHGYFAIRTALHQRWPYDESLRVYGDDVTSRMHLLHSRSVGFCSGKYLYRQHRASCTHHFNIRRIDFVRANTLLRNLLEKNGANEEMLRCCEEYAWRNYIGVLRQMTVFPNSLSPAERKECDDTLSQHLQQMKPSRLRWQLRLHPSFFFVRPYPLLKTWQKTLLSLRRMLKGGTAHQDELG